MKKNKKTAKAPKRWCLGCRFQFMCDARKNAEVLIDHLPTRMAGKVNYELMISMAKHCEQYTRNR